MYVLPELGTRHFHASPRHCERVVRWSNGVLLLYGLTWPARAAVGPGRAAVRLPGTQPVYDYRHTVDKQNNVLADDKSFVAAVVFS